jgi:acyl-CoA dehydrogenase
MAPHCLTKTGAVTMVFKAIMNGLIKAKAMPQISPTERQALEAGTVWITARFFPASPTLQKCLPSPIQN